MSDQTQQVILPELCECQFCKANDSDTYSPRDVKLRHFEEGYLSQVKCESCGFAGPCELTELEAVQNWNTLASAAAQNVVAREALERSSNANIYSSQWPCIRFKEVATDALAKMDTLASAGALVGGGA